MSRRKGWLTIVPVVAALFTGACSTNLARGVAQQVLEAEYATKRQYVYIQTGHNDAFSAPTDYVRVRSGEWRTDAKQAAALSDAGFVKVEVVATGVPMTSLFFHGTVDHIVVTPTEKATPFLAGVFPPGNNNVCNDGCLRFVAATPAISITGVGEPAERSGKKVSVVAFDVSWINTPVGNLLGQQYRGEKREAAFIKYDSGWKFEE